MRRGWRRSRGQKLGQAGALPRQRRGTTQAAVVQSNGVPVCRPRSMTSSNYGILTSAHQSCGIGLRPSRRLPVLRSFVTPSGQLSPSLYFGSLGPTLPGSRQKSDGYFPSPTHSTSMSANSSCRPSETTNFPFSNRPIKVLKNAALSSSRFRQAKKSPLYWTG